MNPLDEAELKADLRVLYKDLGFDDSLKVVTEMLVTASVLFEVICEEKKVE